MTGGDFKLILAPEGGIIGFVSASKDAPFKQADFDKDLEDFDKAKTYADWKFEGKPGNSGRRQAGKPAGPVAPGRPF